MRDKAHFSSYIIIRKKRGDILKEYEKCLEKVKKYLGCDVMVFSEEKLDSIIADELEKNANNMDTKLINLCLDTLAAYRKYVSENQQEM